MKVFLVGYMGCGKTTISKRLARSTGWLTVDMDRLIEEQEQMSVTQIFDTKGEAYFRERERELIEELGQRQENMIIATGGGAPCQGRNMERMNEVGETIYLKMTPEMLRARLLPCREKRPLLRDKSDEEILAFIKQALQGREPYYQQASMIIDCCGCSDYYITEQVELYIKHYQSHGV